MKQSTLILRKRFQQKKATNRFKNWKQIQREVWQANRCAYCLKPLCGEVHIDHVRPISHSKSNRINNYSNLVISCKTCNRLKLDKTGIEYPDWIIRRKNHYKKCSYGDLIRISEEMKYGRTHRGEVSRKYTKA